MRVQRGALERGRVQRWNAEYRIGLPQKVHFRGHLRRMMRVPSRRHAARAYRVAVAMSRHAVRAGDQHDAIRAEQWISTVLAFLHDTSLSPVDTYVRAARQAVDREDWQEALAYNDAILALRPDDPSVRGRALRNRATVLTILGRFEEAVAAYTALMRDRPVWDGMAPGYQVGFQLSRAGAAWHLGPVCIGDLADAAHHIGHGPSTWQAYWWLMGHIAWRDHPERLEAVRLSSLRTRGLDWSLQVDRPLWGLDLLASKRRETQTLMMARVRAALADPVTLQFAGRSGWMNLYSDWLWFHIANHHAEAGRLIAEHVVWCEEQGYDGWAAYWRAESLKVNPTMAQASI